LLKDGDPIPLKPKPFDTLLVLVRNSGRVLDKDELMKQIWPDTVVEEVNLAHNISILRKVLGQKAGDNRFIVTVPGRGYGFVADVRTVERNGEPSAGTFEYELTRSHFIVGEDASPDPRLFAYEQKVKPALVAGRLRSRRALRIWIVVAVMGLLCAAVAGWSVYFKNRERGKEANRLPDPSRLVLKRLTTIGSVQQAALSPDGNLFAYSIRDKDGREELWLGQVDGRTVRLRAPAEAAYRSLSFSRDGSTLYYVNAENRPELFKTPVLGGAPEKVASNVGASAVISPDGKQVAFVRSDVRGASALVIADTDGSAERELAERPSAQAFCSTCISWSPDQSLIAVAAAYEGPSNTHDIVIVRVTDSRITRLTNLGWSRISSLRWLGDGSGLVVSGSRDHHLFWLPQLWLVLHPEGVVRAITNDLNAYALFGVSRESDTLLALQVQQFSNVWVAPAKELSQAKQITFGSIGRSDGIPGLDWTPDGRLVYGALLGNSRTVWIMNADGSDQQQLTPVGHSDQFVNATLDGRYIVFHSDRSGVNEIWRIDMDGSNPLPLTRSGPNSQPAVTPDGRWVVFRSDRDGLLWRVSIDGGESHRVTDRPASWPRVSPDGKLVACGYSDPTSAQTRLAIVPIEGGQPLKLFELPRLANLDNRIRWTPDQAAITYGDWANGIWRQPMAGGESVRLSGLPAERLYTYGWSRDGKRFAFTRGGEIRDLMMIQNFR
jgi:Tol biopolymer transport system component